MTNSGNQSTETLFPFNSSRPDAPEQKGCKQSRKYGKNRIAYLNQIQRQSYGISYNPEKMRREEQVLKGHSCPVKGNMSQFLSFPGGKQQQQPEVKPGVPGPGGRATPKELNNFDEHVQLPSELYPPFIFLIYGFYP